LAFAHAPDETARFAIRTTVFGQSRQRGDQAIDERRTELAGRPLLELAQVQLQPDHREMRVQRWADENGTLEYAHDLNSPSPQARQLKRMSIFCGFQPARRAPG